MTTKSTILAILKDHREDVKEYFEAGVPEENNPFDMDYKIARLIKEIEELP
jgi:hypothetical protein